MIKKLVATQFCIPDLDPLAYRSNVHLAPGYLIGYAKPYFPKIEFIITPRIYTDLLSDEAFIYYIMTIRPDIMTFSLYLWNIERTLNIAKKIKNLLPRVKILFGGPEVTPDNKLLLKSDIFETGIVGEGEIAFIKYLENEDIENIPGLLTKDRFNDFYELRKSFLPESNPYLTKIIETTPDETLFVETVRGCPFNCRFCYYNKVYDKVIQTGKYLKEYIDFAQQHHFTEIFFLDPSFNVQPGFNQILDELNFLNKDHKLKIATELRADLLNDDQIVKLAQMNLVEAEIGLQTTNPKALEKMDRPDKSQKTIENTQKMISAGITCKVDLIAGLPGDNLKNFQQSVDKVVQMGIQENVQVFRLSILPGTEFSLKRDEYGIKAKNIPPYSIDSVPGFSNEDIIKALEYAENAFDKSLYYIPPFLLSTDFTGLNKSDFVSFDSDIEPIQKIIFEHYNVDLDLIKYRLCRSIALHFVISDDKDYFDKIYKILNFFSKDYRPDHLQIILDFRKTVSKDIIFKIASILPTKPSYLDRDATAHFDKGILVSTRMVLIFPRCYHNKPIYEALCEDFDIFLNIPATDTNLIQNLADKHKLFYTGQNQQNIFQYLVEEDLIDEFGLFDTYDIEKGKNMSDFKNNQYYPCTIKV